MVIYETQHGRSFSMVRYSNAYYHHSDISCYVPFLFFSSCYVPFLFFSHSTSFSLVPSCIYDTGYSSEFIDKNHDKLDAYVDMVVEANDVRKLADLLVYGHVTRSEGKKIQPSPTSYLISQSSPTLYRFIPLH